MNCGLRNEEFPSSPGMPEKLADTFYPIVLHPRVSTRGSSYSATRNPQSSFRTPAGFTLFEILAAVGIIVLLLGGLFVFYEHALAQRQRAQELSDQAVQAQFIMDRLANDLTSISAELQPSRSARGFSVSRSVASSPAAQFVGARDSLSCLACQPIPPSRFKPVKDTDPAANSQARRPLYDIQEVCWWWSCDAETGTSGGLFRSSRPAVQSAGDVAESESSANLSGFADGAAQADELYRQQLAEWIGQPADEGNVETDEQVEADPLLTVEPVSPRVQWIYIRYWDGAAWSTAYDSAAASRSPLAVEITLSYWPLLSAADVESGKTAADRLEELFSEISPQPMPPQTYRRVVYLPSAGQETLTGEQMRNR